MSNQPYIFVSYSHADSRIVRQLIGGMKAQGFRIWFDERIEDGSDWSTYIATQLAGADSVIFFISPSFAKSPNCKREINFAVGRNKKIQAAFLEMTELDLGLEMQLSENQAIFRYRCENDTAFLERLCNISFLQNCRDPKIKATAGPVRLLKDVKPTMPKAVKVEAVLDPREAETAVAVAEEQTPAADESWPEEFRADLIEAERGDLDKMIAVAKAWKEGKIVPKNLERAYEFLESAANRGSGRAQVYLGYCYEKGDELVAEPGTQPAPDLAAAIRWYTKAAQNGWPEGQWQLGRCYHDGIGVKRDMVQALTWYRKAAEEDHAKALNSLGVCYMMGDGVEKDEGLAIYYYEMAAEFGNEVAQYNLSRNYRDGKGVRKNLTKAVELARASANKGYLKAKWLLGEYYAKGIGVDADMAEAVRLYREAAETGSEHAMASLGWCYYDGNGVEKNLEMAKNWFEQSAQKNYGYAFNALGYLYENGEKNPQAAFQNYTQAAKMGSSIGQRNLARCYKNSIGTVVNLTQSAFWYKKAAESGDAIAQVLLGAYYEKGTGVLKDEAEAFRWYLKAAQAGESGARKQVARCYRQGIGTDKNEQEAIRWERM